ncbi:hypothetical protein F750_1526 [Streptomyces sp. PAMC 26508]|nr:hypothetical protein F750_1526 [Streptomyces sp. PAMC 26508]
MCSYAGAHGRAAGAGAQTPMGAGPARGNTPTQRCHALGMTDGRTAALRRNGVIVDTALSGGPDLS